MLNLNVNRLNQIQIHTACHRKYQNKSSLPRTSAISSLLQVVRWSDCAALLSPHCAVIHCVIFIQITNLYSVACKYCKILYHHNK